MSERPNILIIHADQHRYDCLGAYGNVDVQTPNIDTLSRDGVRYENAFTCYPVCTPSRYSLITGLHVHQHLGWSNHCTLPAGLPTLPRVLSQQGYHTKAVGKMHYTPTYLDVGFQEMVLAEQDGPGRYDDDYHRWLRAEGCCDRLDLIDQVRQYRAHAPQVYWDTFGALRSDLDQAHHSTTWIGDRAVESIEQWQDGGHLLMVGFIKPHHPFDPPAPWDTMYDPASLTLLPGWTEECLERDLAYRRGYFDNSSLTQNQLRRVMAYYYSAISHIDLHVGRMITTLKQLDLYDNTIIVYTSDHGEFMGFHHLLLKGNHMYDPLIKVPLLIKYPQQQFAGTVSGDLVNNVDLAPALLSQASAPMPGTMSKVDLTPGAPAHDIVFAEAAHGQQYMARTRRHKLLLCRNPAHSQFFDLDRDPFEMNNLIADPSCQPHIDTLRRRLADWILFARTTPAHLDLDAPVIKASNVPDRDDEHVQQGIDYFEAQMSQSFEFTL